MTKVKDSDLEKISGGMSEISLEPSGGPVNRPDGSHDAASGTSGAGGGGGQETDLDSISDSNLGD